MRAILSVSDKAGIEDLAARLVKLGVEIYSTGGTLGAVEAVGVPARPVSELTGYPEIMKGRVKTLHPGVHGGILARRSEPGDLRELTEHGIEPVDVVVVNLYPFGEAIAREGATLEVALENIDIGGPTLVRAAAKNFRDVLALTEPADYATVLDEWEEHGAVSQDTRRWLAAKAFGHVSAYDALVARYLQGDDDPLPQSFTLPLQKAQDLAYGENPHQRAALYKELTPGGGALAQKLSQLGGKELSFNNILDADRAVATVADFLGPTVVIVKHGNPCGLATNPELPRAFELALMGDPMSAYGGIVGVNREIDEALAEDIAMSHWDVVVAVGFSPAARAILTRKRNLRLLEVGELRGSWAGPGGPGRLDWKRVSGGFLAQTPDAIAPDEVKTDVVTERQPTLEEVTDLLFAWRAVEHVRSNAIVLAKDLALTGVGGGLPSRVDAVKLAVQKAGARAEGSVLASDAYFPFADGVEEAARAGVTAVIQPGGSVRDDEVIRAADRHGLAMVFTGRRHFRH